MYVRILFDENFFLDFNFSFYLIYKLFDVSPMSSLASALIFEKFASYVQTFLFIDAKLMKTYVDIYELIIIFSSEILIDEMSLTGMSECYYM